MSYRIDLGGQTKKSLARLPDSVERRILAAIATLADEPFPRGSRRLVGVSPPTWRLRVGDYRVIYSVSVGKELVIIEAVTKRDDQTYRGRNR